MAVTADLLREIEGVAAVFDGTPHGDWLAKLSAELRRAELPPAGAVLTVDDVQTLREFADGAEIIALCDSHEALRRLWRNALAAIAAHEMGIVDGRRDPIDVDRDLWANT